MQSCRPVFRRPSTRLWVLQVPWRHWSRNSVKAFKSIAQVEIESDKKQKNNTDVKQKEKLKQENKQEKEKSNVFKQLKKLKSE